MSAILALLWAILALFGITVPGLDTEPRIGTALYCETLADGSTACWESAE